MLKSSVTVVQVPFAHYYRIGVVQLKTRGFLESDDNVWTVMQMNIQKAMPISDIFLCINRQNDSE
jgi:hypothetical protein